MIDTNDLQQRLDDLLRPQILKNTCRQPEVRVNDRSTEAKKDGGKMALTPSNAA